MIVNGKRYKGLQVHKEKKTGDYIYVHTDLYYINKDGTYYDCLCAYQEGQRLPNAGSVVHSTYLEDDCTNHIPYKQLPEDVRKHLTRYVKE